MKAVVLCAGLGTRLRPLTELWPKPALPLLGQPLLRYTLALLGRAGIEAVGINTHHLPERMEQVALAECERAGLSLEVSAEPVIQGTGGGIRGLRHFVGEETFVVFNGDILFGLDVAEAVAAHRSAGASATMVLLPMPPGQPYSAVEVDRHGWVRKIAGHGPGGTQLAPWHFSGVHVMNPDVFSAMAKSGPEDINRDVYPRLIERGGRVLGHPVSGAYWSDLGTPSRYLQTVQDLLVGKVDLSAFGDASPLLQAHRSDAYWGKGGPRVKGEVTGPAYLEDCDIERGAHLGAGVYVSKGARVGQGARLTRCAVLGPTRIAPGESLVDCIAFGPHRIAAAS